MDPTGIYDLTKFKAFICYHEKSDYNSKAYTKIISDILGVAGVRSFVAHVERNRYSEVFDEVRNTILSKYCKYFIFINTQGSLIREEIIKEFKMAYPNGIGDNPKFFPFRYDSADVSNIEFKTKTGIKLEHNQATFTTEEQLVEAITKIIDTYKIGSNIPSQEELQRQIKLRNNLLYCSSLVQKRNNLDGKTLIELYVQNETILVKPDTWNKRDEYISDYTKWELQDFLQNNQRMIFVSASYGMEKTSWSYKITSGIFRKKI